LRRALQALNLFEKDFLRRETQDYIFVVVSVIAVVSVVGAGGGGGGVVVVVVVDVVSVIVASSFCLPQDDMPPTKATSAPSTIKLRSLMAITSFN
jgi:fatty acid desaturase